MINKKLIIITTWFLWANLSNAQEPFYVKRELFHIPKLNSYTVKGKLSVKNDSLHFLPERHGLHETIHLISDSITKIEILTPLLKNRFKVGTRSEGYYFFTYKSQEVVRQLKDTFNIKEQPINQHYYDASLPLYYPVIPYVLDFNLQGDLTITNQYVKFTSERYLKTQLIPIDDIEKVKAGFYWLLLGRNVLVLKTKDNQKYRFYLYNPKDAVGQIQRAMEDAP